MKNFKITVGCSMDFLGFRDIDELLIWDLMNI